MTKSAIVAALKTSARHYGIELAVPVAGFIADHVGATITPHELDAIVLRLIVFHQHTGKPVSSALAHLVLTLDASALEPDPDGRDAA